MTSHKENLWVFKQLENSRVVKFGNNQNYKLKGYGKMTNEKFTINRCTYVEGLKHNLISVSQLVVGTGNQVLLYDEGSVI